MGSGSSKGTTQVVAADSTRFNSVNNNDQAAKPSHSAESPESQNGDTGQSGRDAKNSKTQPFLKSSRPEPEQRSAEISTSSLHENNTETGDQKSSQQDSTVLLTSFSEKNPKMEPALKKVRDHYQALKDALDNGSLVTLTAVEHVKGVFGVYCDNHKPTKSVLADFAIALGFPKLAYDIIIDRRTNDQGLTTWDREIDKEQGTKTTKGEKTLGSTENQESKEDEDKIAKLKISQDLICFLFGVLVNFSDLHDPFCLACNEAGMVQLFVEMTKELQDSIPHNVKFVEPETQRLTEFTVRGKMLSRSLGILHNLSRRVPTRKTFVACQAVNLLIPLLKAEITFYSAKSLLILAYLIDEENNHLIMTDEGPIKFLTSLLKKAMGTAYHRYLGFAARELAEGLTQIAVNDNNKKTIVKCGAIPILVKMLQKAKDDAEKINACNTLWTLAFDKETRKEINDDEFAIAELRKLVTSENSEIKRAAGGALWECEGKEKHAEGKQQSVTLQQVTGTKHVMISYQWDVQRLVIQLKNKLQADGYKVWMDIDEMGGSTLESMASAVENASVVLVCVSQKYKESPNCRSEAEYTFQLHKDIIPLMMDHKYRPDGWLGFIVGSKFWIDFSEKYKLDSSSDKLAKELGNRGKIASQETTAQAAIEDVVDASPQSSIRSWTCSDVKTWLKDVGFQDRLDPKAAQRLDGQILLRLQDLRRESPEYFYSSLTKNFKLDDVLDVLAFTDALDKLVE